MGITDFSVKILDKIISEYEPNSICELGDQILYTSDGRYGQYADVYYMNQKKIGLYMSIDLNGLNHSEVWDMGKPIHTQTHHDLYGTFDLLTDFGFQEHVGTDGQFDWMAIYNCWLNKWNLLKIGGIMVSENPLSGHWENHGFQWFIPEFYQGMWFKGGEDAFFGLIELGLSCAMGNCETGQNVYAIMKKNRTEFISFETFKTLPLKQS